MNKFKVFVASVVVAAASVVTIAAVPASAATTSTPLCTLAPLKLNEYGKSFAISGDKITAKFTLSGASNCKYDMTLATFKAKSGKENNGQPLSEQTLYGVATGNFGPGQHTLTTTIPDCYYQVDIITGKPINAVIGTRYHDFANLGNFTNLGNITDSTNTAHVHDANFGGTQACPEKPEVCPYDSTMPKDDPNCKPKTVIKVVYKDRVKTNTVVQTQEVAAAPVSSVPSTGADAGSMLASTMGLSTTTGLAYNLFRKRKLVK